MIGNGDVRLTLTVLFAVLGAWYLAAAAAALRNRDRRPGAQVLGAALHVLMSAAMISMFWSWGADIPAIARVTAFTAAAGWFAGQAIFGAGGHPVGGCYGNWYHAGMMSVMVWMPVAVALMSPPSPGGGMSGMAMPADGMAGMAGMPGMAMDGQAPSAASGTAGGQPTAALPMAALPGWAVTVCLVVAAALFAAAAWQAVAALRPLAAPAQTRPPGTPRSGLAGRPLRDGVGALMAVGTAVALLAMA